MQETEVFDAEPEVAAEDQPDYIDREAVAAARELFQERGVAAEAYDDAEEFTLTLTKGQLYQIRGNIRYGVMGFLENVELADTFGFQPTQAQAEDTNKALRQAVELDEMLALLAPTSDYPRPETQGDYSLVS